jgi:hypothetical protein
MYAFETQGTYQAMPMQSDDMAGTLLSGGTAHKPGMPRGADGGERGGAYIDSDGYYSFTYTSKVANLMARDAKKIGLAAALIVVIGILIAIPVSITSSKWYPALVPGGDVVSPSPSPSPSPSSPPTPSPAVIPAAAMQWCSWTVRAGVNLWDLSLR